MTPVRDVTTGRTTVSAGTSPSPSPTLHATSSTGGAGVTTNHATITSSPAGLSPSSQSSVGDTPTDGEAPHSPRKIAVAKATTSDPTAEFELQRDVDLAAVEEWEELLQQLSAPVPKLEGWLSSQPERVQGIFAHKGHVDQLVTAYRLIKLRKMHRQQRVLHTPAGRSSFTFEEKLRRFNSIELLDELALDDSVEGDV